MNLNRRRSRAAAVFWDVITAGTHEKFRGQRETFFRLIITSSLCIVGIAFLGGFGSVISIQGFLRRW